MDKVICLEKNCSTTQLLTDEKPLIKKNDDDKFESLLYISDPSTRIEEGGLRTKGYFKKSYKKKPLVSIITVVFNGEKYLEQTIKSVIRQNYDNVEYIIIDGGSTDGTIEIIKKYDHQIDYWVSEEDSGIYDAMNKGLKLSSGEVIGIINADDWYEGKAVYESVQTLLKSGADYCVANIQKKPSNIIAKPIFPLMKSYAYQEMMYPHVSAFIKKSVYKKLGLFDTSYKISSDFDMALRIHKQNYQIVYLDMIVATVMENGVSSDSRSKKEYLDIVIKHGKNPVLAYATYSLHMFKYYLIQLLPDSIVSRVLKVRKSRFQYEN